MLHGLPTPATLEASLHRVRTSLLRAWTRLRHGGRPGLILITPDPWTVTGSRGDEAMITVILERARLQNPRVRCAMLVADEAGSRASANLGCFPLACWYASPHHIMRQMARFGADQVVIIGADCMDGYYNPDTTVKLLTVAELSQRLGLRVSLAGFSFNATPAPAVVEALHAWSGHAAIHVRDPVSLARFSQVCRHPARLVADVAYLLKPDRASSEVQSVARWADAHRQAGRTVLGFNLHHTLFKDAPVTHRQVLVDSAVNALGRLVRQHGVCVLLMPHDHRGEQSDQACLAAIATALQTDMPDMPDGIRLPPRPLSSSELKAMTASVDGVLTGRMHLAIAALGMGTPVATVDYQDKFEGMLQHFDYPRDLSLTAEEALDPDRLFRVLERLILQHQTLRRVVRGKLAAVLALAEINVLDRSSLPPTT